MVLLGSDTVLRWTQTFDACLPVSHRARLRCTCEVTLAHRAFDPQAIRGHINAGTFSRTKLMDLCIIL
jgi:hypothetical protein